VTGATATVTIRSVAAGGAGVGELPDGRVVFADRTAPGDEVEVEVVEEKRSWARARLVRLRRPGPDRVDPPCPLYDRCGGCALQHLGYAAQRHWKGRIVADALERLGGLDGVEPPEVVPSPREFHYRDRLSFTLRRLRSGRVVAGFHQLHAAHRVLDVDDECLLGEPPLARTWSALRAAWGPGARRLPDGGRLRLTLRVVEGAGGHEGAWSAGEGGPGGGPAGVSPDGGRGVALLVDGGAEGWNGGGLLEEVPALVDVWHRAHPDGAPRRVAGPAGPEPGEGVHPGAFTQVNAEAAPALRDHVVERLSLGTDPDGHVVDAYCGVGVYGRRLAEEGRHVVGIEADPAACAAARRHAPAGFRVAEGAVEDRLSGALPADAVVVNPPRTGLHDRLPPLLLERGPPLLVYVSCDPATLARDLARLDEGYVLTGLRSFDLFPQTAHVETVAVLDARTEGP
jgi:23S rRNA (uracil1939-C5)-methyltransferase